MGFEKVIFPVNETTVGGVELIVEAHSKYVIDCETVSIQCHSQHYGWNSK